METKEDRVMEQYKMMADSTSNVTGWRQKTNDFYLMINSALISIATFLFAVFNSVAVLGIVLFGILLALIWKQSLVSYSKLNKAKFRVLQDIEKKEFKYQIFKMEQDYYKQDGRIGNVLAEKNVPNLFIVMYIIILIFASLKLLGYL